MNRLPDHLFLCSDGGLYDTRRPAWFGDMPIRTGYARHHTYIHSLHEAKACLRAGEFTSLGGCRLAFITGDGAVLSFDAVRSNWYEVVWDWLHAVNTGWKVIGLVNVDEQEVKVFCDHSGKLLGGGDESGNRSALDS